MTELIIGLAAVGLVGLWMIRRRRARTAAAIGRAPSFTGRRRRTTAPSVVYADRAARAAITAGGIGTIIAVGTVFAFLVSVVLPLFRSGSIAPAGSIAAEEVPVATGVDEHRGLGWSLSDAGSIRTFRLDTGETLREIEVFDQPVAAARVSRERSYRLDAIDLSAIRARGGKDPTEVRGREAIVALADGRIRYARFIIATVFHEEENAPAEMRDLVVGETAVWEDRVAQLTPQGQIRMKAFAVDVLPVGEGWDAGGDDDGAGGVEAARAEITSIDCNFADPEGAAETLVWAGTTAGGRLRVATFGVEADFLGNRNLTAYRRGDIALPRPDAPSHVRVSGFGDSVYVAWPDGELVRVALFERRDGGPAFAPRIAETLDLTPAAGVGLTALDLLLGRSTLVAGDASGRVSAWFLVRGDEPGAPEELTEIREIAQLSAAVTAIAPSGRSRMVAVGGADGSVHAFQVTSGKALGSSHLDGGGAIDSILIAPKEDAILARSGDRVGRWAFDPGHPEASFSALFEPVWYEGYPEPSHSWQSTSGSDEGEPKLGLMPLIFGTFKAAFYSMLFGVPLALLAAIYTSEYLEPSARARVKPVIEMMASLPSVVLGFLAGLVFAPFVEDAVATVISVAFGVPLALLLGAHLWALLPVERAMKMARFRMVFIVVALLAGVASAVVIGPAVEHLFFAGDLEAWLDLQESAPEGGEGVYGSGAGGWAFVLLPLAVVGVVVVRSRIVDPRLPARLRGPLPALGVFLISAGATLGLAFLLGWTAEDAFGDPRGGVLGTYVQRNALVVGFVMGFAIIPIIYTVAEDALASVPSHLRSASLGCGATTWQTAVRVVIPTAMSGLFSAVMIGIGRAVGETMIVLMAAGNTPIMEMNVFNGFRTLSANIAVELPEAAKDGTHYRVLFLAGLTLFAMTFVLNTVAEIVRSRFRRRAFQL